MTHKFGNARATARFNSGVVRWGALIILLLFGVALLPSLAAKPVEGVITASLLGAILPMQAHGMRFMDTGDRGGGGEADFEGKVLKELGEVGKTVKSIHEKNDELAKNYEQLDKTTKSAVEELTTLKNQQGQMDDVLRALQKVQQAFGHERRMAYGDPVMRIIGDPEKKARFNAAVRLSMNGQSGDMTSVAKAILGKALGEDSGYGANLIDDSLAQDIYDTLASYGVWTSFGVTRMGTKLEKLPVKTARAKAYVILTEGGQIPDDTNKAGSTVTLTAQVIAALLDISLQLLQDAEFDVTADVMDDFAEAFAERMDYLALVADGTADATNGGMTGIFQGGTLATAATGNTTVETLDFEDFTKVLLTVDPIVLSRPSRWWMHPQILVRALSVKDGNGRPIFLTALEAPAAGAIGSILGYPITPAHVAPSANTASSRVAAFGDPKAMRIGIRNDFYFEASDHHKWDTLQRSFRGYGRAGVRLRRATAMAVLRLAAS